VYDQDSTQEELYLRSAQPVVLSILQVGAWVLPSMPLHKHGCLQARLLLSAAPPGLSRAKPGAVCNALALGFCHKTSLAA